MNTNYPNTTPATGAERMLDALEALGIRYFLGNGGTDFPAIVRAFVSRANAGRKSPVPMAIVHENLAMGMAHGYHLATGEKWVNYSTVRASETVAHEGVDMPAYRLDISAASHPFWTGQAREVDTEGRMDRFRRRYGVKKK